MTILTNDVWSGAQLAVDGDDRITACPFEAVHDLEGRAALLEVLQEKATQVATLTEALESNRRIGIAIGIVMVRLAVESEVAFGAIREVSMSSNRKLHSVAEDVIRDGALSLRRGGRRAPEQRRGPD